eukprot:UN16309
MMLDFRILERLCFCRKYNSPNDLFLQLFFKLKILHSHVPLLMSTSKFSSKMLRNLSELGFVGMY